MSQAEEFHSRLAGVRQRYLQRLVDVEAEIKQLYAKSFGATLNLQPLQQLTFVVHKLRGPAKTLGFDDIGTSAEVCEERLTHLLCEQTNQRFVKQSASAVTGLLAQVAAARAQSGGV